METIKKLILLLSVTAFFLLVRPSFAQMMGGYQGQAPSQSDIQKQQNEQNEGQQFFQGLKEGKISCQKLTNDDFEKLGEYFMGQMIGDTQRHVLMNNMMQSMMGENGEEQMHIVMGQRGSGCLENAPFPSNVPSFNAGDDGKLFFKYQWRHRIYDGNRVRNDERVLRSWRKHSCFSAPFCCLNRPYSFWSSALQKA